MTASARPDAAPDDPAHNLQPTFFLDFDNPAVAEFARRAGGDAAEPRRCAVDLYYAVRDRIRYDPYGVEMSDAGMTASRCLERGAGFCITKAVLLTACLRSRGIPARLGFADVKNHLATERMRQLMQTDLFIYHGYSEVHLDGRWVKATPAFNLSLCQKFRVLPLEFDGTADSVFHPFDADGRQHMEYVRRRGAFSDLPMAQIRSDFREIYPFFFEGAAGPGGDFAAEAERERNG